MDVNKLVSKMTLEEKAAFLSGSDFWHTKAVERLNIPGYMMCDGPNGVRKQEEKPDMLGINESISTVCYPTGSALASSFDVDLAHEMGEALGDECNRENVSMLLGPGLNMKRSPVCGRNFEYYSEDPYLAGKMGAAFVKGVQSKGVLACPKHFAANNQEHRRMSGNSTVDERTLFETYLAAFEMVVKEAKPLSIMCSYNRLNGTYMSENKYLLTDILRDKWGFDGFVVTDWGAAKNPASGVKAGLDLIMPGGNDLYEKYIVAAVNNNELDEALLDKAVINILSAFERAKKIKKSSNKKSVDTAKKKDYELSKKIAVNSAVLLKNNKILPLKDDKKILFVGEFAKKPRYQGAGSSHINSAFVSNAYDEAIRKGKNITYVPGYDTHDEEKGYILREEALKAAQDADIIVIFAGLPNAYESEGFDRTDINIPDDQIKLIDELSRTDKKTVVVMHNGSPVSMPWIDNVDAVLEMFLAGDAVGEATVELLWGEENPSGKLSETYPARISDNPSFLNFPGDYGNPIYAEGIYIGYRYYEKKRISPLFPFGYGLSYTDFEYSNPEISSASITDKDSVEVSVEVWNVGRYTGKEVVELYVSDNECKVTRPLKELKGFKKVELKPGEKKKVSFTLDKRSFAYYDTSIHDFYVESGDFTVMIGASSYDIKHSLTVHVESSQKLPFECHFYTPIEDILDNDKGKEVLGPIIDDIIKRQEEAATDGSNPLGEGADKMFSRMLMEMPVIMLVNYGIMELEEMEELVNRINS